MRWRAPYCALSSLALSACYVGPAYHHPDVPLPAAWVTADADAQAGAPQSDWWRGFGSTQLDDYISRAQAANDDIAAAMARIREADAQARIAGAALLPTIAGNAAATRQVTSVALGGNTSAPFNIYTPGLTASYQVDFWGANRAAHNAALATAQASRFDRETVALTVMTSVALSYFEVLEYRDRLQVARQNRENAQTILTDLEF
jgi:multidrug efflux system outer membrane protein